MDKEEEDTSVVDAFKDTIGFAILNFSSSYLLSPVLFEDKSDIKTKLVRLGISSSIYLTSSIFYEKILKYFKTITGYKSFDKYLFSLGPGIYFNATLTGSNIAVFNEIMALTVLFIRDLYG